MSAGPGGARAVALEALGRIDTGAYANLVLPGLLRDSALSRRDRAFVTELVYGTTRMRRACDWLVDRFLQSPVEPEVRAALRLGAYQLAFTRTPAHAAVAATVDVAPARARGLVNAVLRRVATIVPVEKWPDPATALSYPDWIVDRLAADLGPDAALAVLRHMNLAPAVSERQDGYVQDQASQWVADYVGVAAGERVGDLCAAPGGKATALGRGLGSGTRPGLVVAADVRPNRAALVATNATRLDLANLAVVAADARRPPLVPRSLDRVLVDAPCSGLGVLHRRPDARWRIQPGDVARLAKLQRQLLAAAVDVLRPGGRLVYSVCTLTAAETVDVDRWLEERFSGLEAEPGPGAPWEALGRGARLLPQAAATDGMFVVGLRKAGL